MSGVKPSDCGMRNADCRMKRIKKHVAGCRPTEQRAGGKERRMTKNLVAGYSLLVGNLNPEAWDLNPLFSLARFARARRVRRDK